MFSFLLQSLVFPTDSESTLHAEESVIALVILQVVLVADVITEMFFLTSIRRRIQLRISHTPSGVPNACYLFPPFLGIAVKSQRCPENVISPVRLCSHTVLALCSVYVPGKLPAYKLNAYVCLAYTRRLCISLYHFL